MSREEFNRVYYSLIFSWSFNGFLDFQERWWNDLLTSTVKAGERGGMI